MTANLVQLPKVPKDLKEEFAETCAELDVSQSQALREALRVWISWKKQHAILATAAAAQNDFSEAVGHVATAANALTALAGLIKKQ